MLRLHQALREPGTLKGACVMHRPRPRGVGGVDYVIGPCTYYAVDGIVVFSAHVILAAAWGFLYLDQHAINQTNDAGHVGNPVEGFFDVMQGRFRGPTHFRCQARVDRRTKSLNHSVY